MSAFHFGHTFAGDLCRFKQFFGQCWRKTLLEIEVVGNLRLIGLNLPTEFSPPR